MAVQTYNLGTITAYGDAKAGGYTGTLAEWQALMANYGIIGAQASQNAQIAIEKAEEANSSAIAAQTARAAAEAAAESITVDNTLTQAGKAADAKVTGDEIRDVKEALSAMLVKESFYINPWTQGTIGQSTGANGGSSTRCRSNGYYTENELGHGEVEISIKNGYQLVGRAWDEQMTYLPAEFTDWTTGSLKFTVKRGYHYRFVASKTSGATITPSDCADAFAIVSDGYTDQTLSHTGKSADAKAVGDTLMPFTATYNSNSTILAAKTYVYKDGTAPVTDWYLLADVNGNLYISKDFSRKVYITRFTGWNMYKFAVRQNGDIIAVYRTEFTSAGSTYDSSLDERRQNPFVCLWSEGYSVWHEVDFGTSKKPCGWLENCGVCTLPNGDIIFSEYTRMMVMYTANLWRIRADADITQATSWEILKTFQVARNDTDTYDETVIEHFHAVQVDPYTGTVYFTTGDKGNKSQIWYSSDNGSNWTKQAFVDPSTSQTITSGNKLFRLLNFCFTSDKIYWVSDDPEDHVVISCERGTNGFDPSSIRVLTTIPLGTGRPATYGQVLFENLGLIVMLDRLDGTNTEMLFRAYDLIDGSVKTILTIKSADSTAVHVGFRTEYTDFDPIDGIIKCGFGMNELYRNYNAICGNTGTDFANNINNISIRISVDTDRNVYARFGTYYI